VAGEVVGLFGCPVDVDVCGGGLVVFCCQTGLADYGTEGNYFGGAGVVF